MDVAEGMARSPSATPSAGGCRGRRRRGASVRDRLYEVTTEPGQGEVTQWSLCMIQLRDGG